MMKWLTWKSWTLRSPQVSVTAAVIFFTSLSLLLSSTTVSLSGSAFVSLTSNVTAFFTNLNIDNNPAAEQAIDIAPGIHQGGNSSATNLNDSFTNAVAGMPTPSIQPVISAPPSTGPQEHTVLKESHDEELYGVAPNLAWSPVAAPSVLNKRKPDVNQIEEASRTTASLPLLSPSPSPAVFHDELSNWSPVAAPSVLDKRKPDVNHTEEASRTTASLPLLSPSPSPAVFHDELSKEPPVENFLMPLLSYQVGAGNQLMEYMSAAIMARALNRTLCLAHFFPGPNRHTGKSVRGGDGLALEDRYDKESLSRFVRVTSKNNCLKQCNRKLDARWLLKPMREPIVKDWKSMPRTNESLQLSWDYVRWQTPADIAKGLGSSNEHCVAVGGLFPGLRWRGGFLAVSAFLRPSKRIAALADDLQAMAIGINVPYLAVHWRFEQSECGSRNSGLCFVRCDDGAIIDSGLHPYAKEWIEMSKDKCKRGPRGVGLDKFDVFNAISDRALNYSLKTVYLATDGWIRGRRGAALVKEAVEELRNRGLAVVGLWNIKNLPNFSDGSTFDPKSTLGARPVNGHQIALVEQEICTRSSVFLGSSQSTWSLAVFRLRLARRRAKEILESGLDVTRASRTLQQQGYSGLAIEKQVQEQEEDEAVIEELMNDNHAAGLQCRYYRYFNRIRVNATVETYADEVPDGWLDLEACEGRIGRGGKCTVAKCF